ncbi:hypothetical protein QYE76_064836 [Lolium multiflorum]|uniref:TF-B3 domain-containing protein n=1 Tax=Lolium multiflorum TaxID=4521 RepID=A0AAD8S7A4_LOLMU|nr:hypothetical protein QYE76_064836 [Lolium multiflorum]
MEVSPGPGLLRPEGCTCGEGRRKHRVPSGTRAIISLTAPLSFLSLATALSPPNCHITRRFPSRRPIRRTAARRSTGTKGGDLGEQHRDIGRNLLRSLHQHLDFARDLELVLGRSNGGNDLSSPSYSFCQNMPFSGICDDMHIRTARVSITIGFRLMFARPAKVGHFHEEARPDYFLKIIFKPTFGRLMIPKAFVKWFGEIPSTIIVTTNSGCNWMIPTRREGNNAFIDQGWTAFAVAHQLKVG